MVETQAQTRHLVFLTSSVSELSFPPLSERSLCVWRTAAHLHVITLRGLDTNGAILPGNKRGEEH